MLEPVCVMFVLFVMCIASVLWHLSSELYLFVLLGCLDADCEVRSVVFRALVLREFIIADECKRCFMCIYLCVRLHFMAISLVTCT